MDWYVVSCGPHDWEAVGTDKPWDEFSREMRDQGHAVNGVFDTKEDAEEHAQCMTT